MTSRHQLYRVIESLIVTNLTHNLLSFIACWGSVNSLTVVSVIIFPILQQAMSTISEKLHNLWKSSHSIGADSVQMEDEDNKPVLSPETQNRLRLRKVLEDLHRMMYYTVTISTIPPVRKSAVAGRKTSTLRWQYATTLTKTQATMRKSTVHCPTYYNITYLGELLESDEDDDLTDIEQINNCSVIKPESMESVNK